MLLAKEVKTKCLFFFFLVILTGPVSSQRDPRFDGNPQTGDDANPAGGGLLSPLFPGVDAVDRYPAWKQTFLVKYNTSTASVTNRCGTHYAEEFLKNFFKVTQEILSYLLWKQFWESFEWIVNLNLFALENLPWF